MTRREVGAMRRWFGATKRRLGYYELRARLHEGRFRSALRPSDTFLVGHPKSGNTWLAYMLAMLVNPQRREEVSLLNVGDFVPFIHGRDHDVVRYPSLPDPRVFRNEQPLHHRLYPRTIYLVRDPRAVLVSFWHMYRVVFDDDTPTLEDFVWQYMNGRGCFTYWQRHLVRWDRQVRQYIGRRGRSPSTMIIRYEDLVRDRLGELRRVASFLAIDADDDLLHEIAERGRFDAMRRDEELHGAEAYEGRALGSGRFVRKGKIDGWRDEMDGALADRIALSFAAAMRTAGYE
jgi:hypothetical protein